ncbi:MAG: hypothetical protein AAB834_06335 [Patescibacteria group bacterium]
MYRGTEQLREDALAKITEAIGTPTSVHDVALRGTEIMRTYDHWKQYTEERGTEPTDILPRTLRAIRAMSEMEATCGANLMNDPTALEVLDGVVSRVGDYWLVQAVPSGLLQEAVVARQAGLTK